jgi:MoaA/NifB/PqqE/SkfB family radical SAM enzyme
MTAADWAGVIDGAAELGVREVSMIGGEPTLHPALPELVGRALDAGMTVEIFTNLIRIPNLLWPTLTRPGVSIATSYYAADPAEHDRITGRRGSYALTRANIVEVLRREIPLRVNIVGTGDSTAVDQAQSALLALGVRTITRDEVRPVGRAGTLDDPGEAGTCGRCGHGRAAISPEGIVTPCVFSRRAPAGNVRVQTLGDILSGAAFAGQVARLDAVRPGRITAGCGPDSDTKPCGPTDPEPDPN